MYQISCYGSFGASLKRDCVFIADASDNKQAIGCAIIYGTHDNDTAIALKLPKPNLDIAPFLCKTAAIYRNSSRRLHGLHPFCVDQITIWKDDVMVRLLGRKSDLYRTVGIALICCTTGFGFSAAGFCAPAPVPEAQELSVREKEKLVQKAVAHYEKKEMAKARQGLEKAEAVFPENHAVPYYLGLIHLERGDRKTAIAQWQRYVRLDPQSENALNIRKHITLLLREQAREFARQAVAREAELAEGRADDKTIAVASFRNMGSEALGPLGKGMASMLIYDLSLVPDLQVVDRIRLQALLDEMQLGTSGLVDMNSAPRVGKLLKAKHVTSGTLADIEKERLVIASAVVDTDRRASVGAQEAKGLLKHFYDMEKRIACQIIQDLGKNCNAVPAGFHKIHTKSMPALVAYSRGLDHFDKENYDEAREHFQKAIDEDPRFELAIAALLATPPSSMAAMDRSQMISNASAGGPSSATAGTAVAGATAATMAASSMGGISPTTAIVGGVAILGGGVALAGGGGGGGGGEPGPQPAAALSLTGDWRGTWDDDSEATFSMTQTNESVSGTVTLIGDACLATGNVSGTVAGNTADLTIQSGAETIALAANINSSAKTLAGTLDYQASAATGCIGRTGNFSVALTTGGAEIDW